MRLNKYIAQATGISRREADKIISAGKVLVNGVRAELGNPIMNGDKVELDGKVISLPKDYTYLLFDKPVGIVTTRKSQDTARTVYELLPEKYHQLKYVGRLDKESSGLLLLTNDGDFTHHMTHPSFEKGKTYELRLARSLKSEDLKHLNEGVKLEDGVSKLNVERLPTPDSQLPTTAYQVRMHEGRNRQIRRTFGALGYEILELKRTIFGPYSLDELGGQQFIEVNKR